METYGLIDLSTIVKSGFVESGYTGSSITNFEIDQQQNIIFSIYFPNQIPFRENHSKLIKIKENGEKIWELETSSGVQAVTKQGNIITSGGIQHGKRNGISLSSISKDGELQWTKDINGDGYDGLKQILISGENIYAVLESKSSTLPETIDNYNDQIRIDPKEIDWNLKEETKDNTDIVIYKYNESGSLLDTYRIGSKYEDRITGVFVDDQSKGIYLYGYSYLGKEIFSSTGETLLVEDYVAKAGRANKFLIGIDTVEENFLYSSKALSLFFDSCFGPPVKIIHSLNFDLDETRIL